MQRSIRLSIPTQPVPGAAARALAFALVTMTPGAFAEGPAIPNYFQKSDLQIAEDVAPYVYFHKNEHNWPDTYENFLLYSTLRRKSDGAIIANGLNTNSLLRLSGAGTTDSTGKDLSAGYYLDLADWMYKGDADLSRTRPYVRVHNKAQMHFTKADPVTGAIHTILTLPAYKEIQFWFFFPFNGCQTHRTYALGSDLQYYRSRFQMCDAGRHEGDLEAVSVFINQSNGKPMGIATTRHGDVVYTHWEQTKNSGTHPSVYSAWGSHAMYTTPGRKSLSSPEMGWLAGLLCSIGNLSSWNLYDLPTARGKRWDPTLVFYRDKVIMTDTSTPITKYRGNWGLMGMNNWNVQLPSAPGYDSNMGQDVVKAVSDQKIASCFASFRDVANLFVNLKNTLTGNGTDWFSKNDWLNGMTIDSVGQ